MKYCLSLILALTITSLPASVDLFVNYYSAEARDGDGIFTLLRRYDLLKHDCNLEKFYALNNLTQNDVLLKGKKYLLPIVVFNYNGTSIRSTIGINNWEKAKRIQAYNDNAHETGLKHGNYRTDKVLWVPHHELNCASNAGEQETVEEEETPTEKISEDEAHLIQRMPLFGPKYEKVHIRSNRLNGQAFYLVSGHGGPDPGAVSNCSGNTLCEDEYAYDVTLRLARGLMEQGARVHIIIQDANDGIRDQSYLDCDKDEKTNGTQTIPLSQIQRLSQRVQAINSLHKENVRKGFKKHTVVCIHVDSRNPNKRQDVFFYHCENSKTGKKIANNLQDTFAEKYRQYRANGNYHGTVTARGLYMLRNTDPTAVYVELANIRNTEDRKRILPESNRQALANWLCEGLMKSVD